MRERVVAHLQCAFRNSIALTGNIKPQSKKLPKFSKTATSNGGQVIYSPHAPERSPMQKKHITD